MKQLFEQNIKFLLLTGMMALFFGCEEDAKYKEYVYPAPTVTGISPADGYIGSELKITGTDLSGLTGAVKVAFGGISATVLSCTDNEIVVEVPDSPNTTDVTLQVWTHDMGKIGTFTAYIAPTITAITSNNALSPYIAEPGVDIVTITGYGFGTDDSKFAIEFNGVNAPILTIVDDKITVKAPADYEPGEVYIAIGSFKVIGGSMFNPYKTGDVSPYFLKNYGPYNIANSYINGRWGTLDEPWIVNDQILNKVAGMIKYGGWTRDSGGEMVGTGFFCGETHGTNGSQTITDGVIYQVTTLPAGTYKLSSKVFTELKTDCPCFIVAAAGTGLPLTGNLSTEALGYAQFSTPTPAGSSSISALWEIVECTFTIASTQEVSLGFVINMSPINYYRAGYLFLEKI